MSRTQVRVKIDGPHAAITLWTEEGLNVLSPDVLQSFGAALAKVKMAPKVRTTAIQATGKVFVAGADIKAMQNYSADDAREYASVGQGIFNDLASLPSITVAAINGAALGGGLELALACDFRIAVKSAKLGLPEVTLGLIPGWNGIPRLTKLVGQSHAKRLYLSGVPVSAEDGLAFGLVDEIVNSADDLGHRVAAFCKTFNRTAPAAVALAKRASRDMDDLTAFADCFHTTDCREGISAFLNKRPAAWMEE
jgi:enoyl-CoA hydratase